MPEYEYKTEIFECGNLGCRVRINRKVLIHHSGATGEVDYRATAEIDCEDKSEECGVQVIKGNTISYDWTKCVHPELKR